MVKVLVWMGRIKSIFSCCFVSLFRVVHAVLGLAASSFRLQLCVGLLYRGRHCRADCRYADFRAVDGPGALVERVCPEERLVVLLVADDDRFQVCVVAHRVVALGVVEVALRVVEVALRAVEVAHRVVASSFHTLPFVPASGLAVQSDLGSSSAMLVPRDQFEF